MDDLYKTLYQYWIAMRIEPTVTLEGLDRGRLRVIFEKDGYRSTYIICQRELEEKDFETVLVEHLGYYLADLRRKGVID